MNYFLTTFFRIAADVILQNVVCSVLLQTLDYVFIVLQSQSMSVLSLE